MALDVMLLANQVRDMTKLVVDGATERRRRRVMVQQTIDKHVGHEDHWNDAVVLSERAAWLMAQASESFDTKRDLPPVPSDYALVATDGSQLDVERHGMAVCYLINIGQVFLQYGTTPSAVLQSQPALGYRDDELYISDGMRRIAIEGQLAAKVTLVVLPKVPDALRVAGRGEEGRDEDGEKRGKERHAEAPRAARCVAHWLIAMRAAKRSSAIHKPPMQCAGSGSAISGAKCVLS